MTATKKAPTGAFPEGSTVDLPFSEALKDLTGWEILGIEKRYGDRLENLGGVRSMLGGVWAYRNREEKTDWSSVERMTLRQLDAFFAPEQPDGPLGDQGKASSS